MSEKWQRLHLANKGNTPPLLFKYSTTASGYELYITDLNYIWSENLDRKAVLKRADEDDTTIDPSEDLEQFKVLLQKIGEGLQNEPGSKTSLNPKTRGSAHSLEFTVTSKLPAPLRPLRWKLCLSKEPQSSMTSHLLLPFINAEADREACQQSLIDELNKKDWALAKIFDKIEAIGVDLSTIFPGTSGLRSAGRKGPTLAQAAKYIRGLAPFNEQAWREEVFKSSPNAGLSSNIVAEMSAGSRDSGKLDSLNPPPDEWWTGLTISDDTLTASTLEGDSKPEPTAKPLADGMDIDADAGSETGEDDEFERQETPPHLKKPESTPQKSTSTRKYEDEVTQSEDEEATFPKRKKEEETKSRMDDQPPPAMRPKAAPAGKPKGLGKIGGKKQTKPKSPTPTPTLSPSPSPQPRKTAAAESPSPPPVKKQQQPVNNDDDETTDGDTDDEAQPKLQPKPNTQDNTKPAAKPSRGLGFIGGKKKKQPTPEPEPQPESESDLESDGDRILPSRAQSQSRAPEAQPQSPAKKKPLGRIGVIGGQKKDKAKEQSTEMTELTQTETTSPPAAKTTKTTKATPAQETDDEEIKREEETRTSSPPKEKKVVKKETPIEPEREETEEEKADRKREELKRQLEAKSKAPAKKKRRF
ncbi:hypothetical protein ASPVEDRAFT_133928 [Aspergillus versicolor CBS 583.65]|uniref:Non-homologous end-joining factor 1 n=1 Tax=Aspergillus versicolor CBS 583.65 TaxID=1036611 RepID=A0A1L9PQ65_ASPVE|nr:uncharacterized protein ASPVEDRAFT_133928 [Aspergillus versicolor CBS 583.65]OJJ03575.1 hypothetical protein ASPVEDRAFT_133928 [Aspergillus versicolor CBS 583.65]